MSGSVEGIEALKNGLGGLGFGIRVKGLECRVEGRDSRLVV